MEEKGKKRSVWTRILTFAMAVAAALCTLVMPFSASALSVDDRVDWSYSQLGMDKLNYEDTPVSQIIIDIADAYGDTYSQRDWGWTYLFSSGGLLYDQGEICDWDQLSGDVQNALATIVEGKLGFALSSVESAKWSTTTELKTVESYFPGFSSAYAGGSVENTEETIRESVSEIMDAEYTLYDIISGKTDPLDSEMTSMYAASDYQEVVNLWARHGYSIDSGADFWTFISDPGGALKAWLAGGAASTLAAAMQSVDNMTDSANELLNRDLDGGAQNGGDAQYPVNEIIYRVCYTICTDVVLPVAGVILAFVFAYQIYELVCERNNMNDMGAGVFIQLFIKMFIAIIVIMNAWALSMWVFDLARFVVNSATDSIAGMGSATLFSDLPETIGGHSKQEQLEWVFTYMICVDSSIDFGSCLVLFLQGLIIQIGMWIVSMLVSVIIYIRMIEIYIYCTLSPVPLATLMNRSWGQVGMNFIRSLAALAFQALIICLCLGIFNVLVAQTLAAETNSLGNVSDLTSSLWAVIGYAVILVFCLFRSGSLSRSIMNAH
ncbi:MAG: hypothetical protein LUD72_09265 [Bacteroidales bacterium]|nr:hypothetical protein [Bacteroidales bacterium]